MVHLAATALTAAGAMDRYSAAERKVHGVRRCDYKHHCLCRSPHFVTKLSSLVLHNLAEDELPVRKRSK